ncbi:peptidoglycan recognition protein family protein [Sphingobacterium bovistauri]|uniref:N-acetylmuramoyl-L-alanine amidase n=1 Tax=Sphingobacterium bovistauri TaxID=2781959 RepID=A0ABS7Z8G8_9SPHI|nr:peptidoglycan recognition family protein [Sphingobacterium bovistauri]MCA5005711.1 N-acetylmuramoyl-L-alanine amidase [Sphingobacterium bovistauri]
MKIIFIRLINCVLILMLGIEVYSQDLRIYQTPLEWNKERDSLTIEYLNKRHGIHQDDATIVPTMVVVHWTANDSYEKTMAIFKSPFLNGRPELLNQSRLNVSSQYIIERDGTIFQLLPDTIFARHTIGLNYCAIGIENIGSNSMPLTKKQLNANARLIKYLSAKYPIKYVIGHHEYGQLKNTSLWKETDLNYFTNKIDPGDKFMKGLRRKIRKLKLQKLPTNE